VSARPATVPRALWTRPARRRVRSLRDRLRLLYGRPLAPPHGQGVEELILTVLSQSTNDRNRDVAYLRLRARFPGWEEVLPVAEARAYLTALPGVGRKTAACVLLFAFGSPDVPVDTHVSRVGTRLGLFRPGAPFEELHDEMLALTPRGGELELHVNLLRHGRRTCHAQRPACGECALLRLCPYGRRAA
jgi:endonuclease III